MPRGGSGAADADAAGLDRRVWLLGNTRQGADRSFGWDEDFGNLSDPDVLIVDLTTLTEDVLQRIDKTKLDQAQRSIGDKLFYGGTTVVITQPEFSTSSSRPLAGRPDSPFGGRLRDPYTYSNYHILPAVVSTKKVPTGFEIRARSDHPFRDYIDAVESFGFIVGVDADRLPPGPMGDRQAELGMLEEWSITDNSGHHLGFGLAALVPDRFGHMRTASDSGRLVFLPPPTEPIDRAIERIVSIYKEILPSDEAPPAWAAQIPFEGPDQLQIEIEQIKAQRVEIDGRIAGLVQKKDEITAHRRLLHAKGPDLEDAVGLAFRALGFAEIASRGGRDAADLIFDAATNGYQRVVVEVKGADKRTKHRHIVQCNKWADDLAERSGESIKGVLVANQYCTSEYPGSIEDRIFFELNELDYAHKKDVCIIPSCDLYEAVKKVLNGASTDRNATEQKITGAKGVLRDVL